MIKFDKVSKKFGNIIAVEEISFEIKDGNFVFITGPSGAGKTTIVKLILREFLPTTGSISVDDLNLAKVSPRKIHDLRRKIGVVFQDFRLLSDRTVFENVALPLEIVSEHEKDIKKKVEEVLGLVGLTERSDLFPAQLAGGELQRVCLARAVIGNPKMVLADEPTGNLDPTTSWQIVKLLKKINKMGTTILMATHNVDVVNSLRERVIRMDKGKIVQDQVKGRYEET